MFVYRYVACLGLHFHFRGTGRGWSTRLWDIKNYSITVFECISFNIRIIMDIGQSVLIRIGGQGENVCILRQSEEHLKIYYQTQQPPPPPPPPHSRWAWCPWIQRCSSRAPLTHCSGVHFTAAWLQRCCAPPRQEKKYMSNIHERIRGFFQEVFPFVFEWK